MDLLSDDVFHHILSFIPSCKELASMSRTCTRAYYYIHESNRTDPLFRTLWFQQYQTKGSRRHYQSIYNFQQLLKCSTTKSSISSPTSARTKEQPASRTRKCALLTPAQEHAALEYDNGADSSTVPGGMGYFGMKQLWDYGGPVIIWGDFYGVRIFSGGTKGTVQDRERIVDTIGEDESHVLCVQVVPDKKLIFLGFASGKVVCIQAVWVDKHRYSYRVISSATKHTDEVTTMCLIAGTGELLSASVDGSIVKYPFATSEKTLGSAKTIAPVGNAVLTMTTMEYRGRTFILTGDQGAYVSLFWEISDQEWRHSYTKLDGQGVPTQTLLWLDQSDLYVIVGDNDGRILTWRVDDHLELEWMGDLAEEFLCNKVKLSAVESFTVEGNLLLVGAGRNTAAFELPNVEHSKPKYKGALVCHPKPHRHSSVVSCYLDHDRQSCVTLCRDGTLHEWSYQREELVIRKKEKREHQRAANKRKREKAATAASEKRMGRKAKATKKVMSSPKQRKEKSEGPQRKKEGELQEEDSTKEPTVEASSNAFSLRPRKKNFTYAEQEENDSFLDVSQFGRVANGNGNFNIFGKLAIDTGGQQGKGSTCALDRFMQSQEEDAGGGDELCIDIPGVAAGAAHTSPMAALNNFMTNASEKNRRAMKMRIIQAAVQYFKNKQLPTFLGVDNVRYGHIQDAFEKHSGFSPCSKCKGSYACRVDHFHTQGMTFEKGHHAENLLKCQREAKNFAQVAAPCVDGHVCDCCHTTLTIDRRRCYVCNTRVLANELAEQVAATPAAPPKHEDDFQVVVSKAVGSPTEVTKLIAVVKPSKIASAPSLLNEESADKAAAPTIRSSASVDTIINELSAGSQHAANEHERVVVLPFDIDESELKVVQMWSCRKCEHFNGTRRFRCSQCKKSSGGTMYKVLVRDQKPVLK